MKSGVSSELDRILRVRRQVSGGNESPSEVPPPPFDSLSGGSKQCSPTFDDSFVTQSFEPPESESKQSAHDWSWADNQAAFDFSNPPFEDPYEETIVLDDDEPPATANPTTQMAEFAIRSYPILSYDNQPMSSIKALAHPFNGNLITCRQRSRKQRKSMEWVIEEVDPAVKPCSTIASTPVLSSQFMQQFHFKAAASSEDTDWTGILPVGLHNVVHLTLGISTSSSSTQVHVAAILDIAVIRHSVITRKSEETTSTKVINQASTVTTQEDIRLIAVWQLGNSCSNYTTRNITLKYLVPLPSMHFSHDPLTITIADGLLFLGGSMDGLAYLATIPLDSVNVFWSFSQIVIPTQMSNNSFTKPSATRVAALAATLDCSRQYKFLAVALDNGDMAVMKYDTEDPGTDIAGNQSLQLLVTLQGTAHANFYSLDTPQLMEGPLTATKQNIALPCTQFSWIQPGPSNNQLPLLAVAVPNGVLIYLISLKLANECETVTSHSSNPIPHRNSAKENPKSSSPFRKKTVSQSAQTQTIIESPFKVMTLNPICISRISGQENGSSTTLAWLDIGSRFPPCLGIMIGGVESTHFILTSLDVDVVLAQNRLRTLCSHSIGMVPYQHIPLITSTSLKSILVVNSCSVIAFTPMLRFNSHNDHFLDASTLGPNPLFIKYTMPVSSPALGMDSNGFVSKDSDDSFLHIFSSLQYDQINETRDVILTVKHYLCRTTIVDSKKVANKTAKSIVNNVQSSSPGAVCQIIRDLSRHQTLSMNTHRMTNLIPRSSSPLGVSNSKSDAKADVCSLSTDKTEVDVTSTSCARLKINLIPYRIAISKQFSAVLFTSPFVSSVERGSSLAPLDPIAIAIFSNMEETGNIIFDEFDLYEGRDISFFKTTAFIINATGDYVTQMIYKDSGWIRSRCFAPTVPDTFNLNRIHILTTGHILCSGRDRDALVGIFPSGSCRMSRDCSRLDIFRPKRISASIGLDMHERIDELLEMGENDCGHIYFAASSCLHLLMFRLMHGKSLQLVSKTWTMPHGSIAPIGNLCIAFVCTASTRCSQSKLEYISLLKGSGSRGTVATIPSSDVGYQHIKLVAVRPDRFLYLTSNAWSVADDENIVHKRIPFVFTRPLIPLEPLVSNYLARSQEGFSVESANLVALIERFVNFNKSDNYSDDSLGRFGIGINYCILTMLNLYGSSEACHIFLNYQNKTDTLQGKIMLPWVSRWSKLKLSDRCHDAVTGIINAESSLPLPSDPISCLSRLAAKLSLKEKEIVEAISLLDFAGDYFSNETIVLLLMLLQTETLPTSNDCYYGSHSQTASITPVDYLTKYLRYSQTSDRRLMGEDSEELNKVIQEFSPSYHKGLNKIYRTKNLISSQLLLNEKFKKEKPPKCSDTFVIDMSNEKNIWFTGPLSEKEMQLRLNRLEYWLGCRYVKVLGKDGVDAIAGRGEKILASLVLNAPLSQTDEIISDDAESQGWVDGVGEGRSDEENLTLYLRFSEGVESDKSWETYGFQDLSQFGNKIQLVNAKQFALERTTSSVDEGAEDGKVKILCDLVWLNETTHDKCNHFMYVEVLRGSSLDTGIWQSGSRQRGSLEFWFYCPQGLLHDEIVLARRSTCPRGETIDSIVRKSKDIQLLWELVLTSNGSIEFRTLSNTLSCLMNSNMSTKDDDDSDTGGNEECDSYRGWTHICVTFNSKNMPESYCQVSLMLQGYLMATSSLAIAIPNLKVENAAESDNVLSRTYLLFGLGAKNGFRITELRYWACDRSVDDTRMMMYEYLSPAETRKKLLVKIRQKNSQPKLPLSNLLAPPKGSKISETGLSANGSDTTLIDKSSILRQSNIIRADDIDDQLRNISEEPNNVIDDANPSEPDDCPSMSANERMFNMWWDEPKLSTGNVTYFEKSSPFSKLSLKALDEKCHFLAHYDLSDFMKPKIAAAIVKGPSATNHFGGYRGGLSSCHSLEGRRQKTNIVVCSSEKTVIFRCDASPSTTTYPVGANSAILWSSVFGDEHEYLTCYQSKQKKIIVFDLSSNIVTVELQMSLKLIFWRYLPPDAHGNACVLMLVTSGGGFHFLPLDESPRPRQVWGKNSCLQGKKVIAYEEGGCNGKTGSDIKSAVALLLISPLNSSVVEAHCLQLFESSLPSFSISMDIMGAALFSPKRFIYQKGPTLPYIMVVSAMDSSMVNFLVEVIKIDQNSDGSLMKGESIAEQVINLHEVPDEVIEEPSLTMGVLPQFLCLCCNDHSIFIYRKTGTVFIYRVLSDDLSLLLKDTMQLQAYVVDATISSFCNTSEHIELTILTCGSQTTTSGQIVVIRIKI